MRPVIAKHSAANDTHTVPAEREGCPKFELFLGRTGILREIWERDDFRTHDGPHFAVRQIRHLQMGKVKTRVKLGYASENLTFQDGE